MPSNNSFILKGSCNDIAFFSQLTHDGPGTYQLERDLTINASDILGSSYTSVVLNNDFIFDGNHKTIIIKYDSFDECNKNPFNGIFNLLKGTVKNLKVKICDHVVLGYQTLSNPFIGVGNGIIATAFAGASLVDNCEVNGDIIFSDGTIFGGSAIFGAFAATNTQDFDRCIVKNCKVTGNIISKSDDLVFGGGSMVGAFAAFGGNVQIYNCASTGNVMAEYSGGIAGAAFGFYVTGGPMEIVNCTSSGDISGNFSGGIVGSYAGPEFCDIINCSTSGKINGYDAGGIVGAFAGYLQCVSANGTCTVLNCTSSGDIAQYGCGGIAGAYAGVSGSVCSISNCTTFGKILESNAGGIVGGGSGYSDRMMGSQNKINPNVLNYFSDLQHNMDPSVLGLFNPTIMQKMGLSKTKMHNMVKVFGKVREFRQIGQLRKGLTNTREVVPNQLPPKDNGLIIDYCMYTGTDPLPDLSSGRMTGENTIATISNCYFYAEFAGYYLIVMAGQSSSISELNNHPVSTIKGRKMFINNENIRFHEYDGFQGVAVDDGIVNYGANISKLSYDHKNVHPLCVEDDKILTQREIACEVSCNSDCNSDGDSGCVVMEFDLMVKPSEQTLRFWIPNSSNNSQYALFNMSMDKLADLQLANDTSIDEIAGCNVWECAFPSQNCQKSCKNRYYVVKINPVP